MDDAAVASRLVGGERFFLFEKEQAGGWGLLENLIGGGESDYSSSYDCNVVWWHSGIVKLER